MWVLATGYSLLMWSRKTDVIGSCDLCYRVAPIIGKSSPNFFQPALTELGLPSKQVAIIGDNIDSDIGGGQSAGLTGILAKTGKYRIAYADNSPIIPDLSIQSIAELPGHLSS